MRDECENECYLNPGFLDALPVMEGIAMATIAMVTTILGQKDETANNFQLVDPVKCRITTS